MDEVGNESVKGKWENFGRQRRNLVLIAVFMFALAFTNSNIEQLSLLGNKINIGDKSKIPFLLWGTFFYFLMRYYYAHKEINDHSMKENFKNILLKNFGVIAYKDDSTNGALLEKAKETLKQQLGEEESLDDYKIYTHMHPPVTESRKGNLWLIKTNWAVISEDKKTGHIDELGTQSAYIKINYANIRKEKIKAWFKLIASKYYFTEYYLPYVFALITLTLSICVGKFIF